MGLKTTIALVLGLVFQLAQVLPGAFASAPSGPLAANSCECCAGLDSCPCAGNETPAPKPSPLAPASGSDLKLPAAKTDDTRVSPESLGEIRSSAMVAASPVPGPQNGYAGVRLSVAFCSFVI